MSSSTTIYTPIVQDGFSYDMIHDQLYNEFLYGGGSISVNQGIATLSIGTDEDDYALLRNREVLKYRTGYPTIVRFSAKYSTSIPNLLQMCGLGTSTNDIYLGYSGTDFVARVSKGGAHETRTLQITAGASGTESFTLTLNDVVFNGTVTNTSIDFNTKEIEIANTYTGIEVTQIQNELCFKYINIGEKTGTFSFSSTGTCAGTFTRNKTGASLTTTLVTKDNFNGDSALIRQLNPTTWNMYEIEYGWYGVTNIVFRIFDEYTNRYRNLHTIRYSDNPNITIGLNNPSLYIQRFIASIGSTTASTIETAGVFAGMIGSIDNLLRPSYSVSHTKTILPNTETVILVLTHRNIINGYTPVEKIDFKDISIATDSAVVTKIKLYKNPTSIGSNTINDFKNLHYVNSSSITLYDINSTTYSGGLVVQEFILQPSGQLNKSLNQIFLQRNETLFITATSSSDPSVHISIGFTEDV